MPAPGGSLTRPEIAESTIAGLTLALVSGAGVGNAAYPVNAEPPAP